MVEKVEVEVEVEVEIEKYEALEKFGNDIWPSGIISSFCFFCKNILSGYLILINFALANVLMINIDLLILGLREKENGFYILILGLMFFSFFRIELDSKVMISLSIVYASEDVLHLWLD